MVSWPRAAARRGVNNGATGVGRRLAWTPRLPGGRRGAGRDNTRVGHVPPALVSSSTARALAGAGPVGIFAATVPGIQAQPALIAHQPAELPSIPPSFPPLPLQELYPRASQP